MGVLKSFKEWAGLAKPLNQELDRSQYSLVSCGELTADTIQLWLRLPEEVKNDPALAPFRQYYEKEHCKAEAVSTSTKKPEGKTRLPLVNSAPILLDAEELCKEKVEEVEVVVADNRPQNTPIEKNKEKKNAKAKYYVKMTVLLACWIFFTVIFLSHDVKKQVTVITWVAAGEVITLKAKTPESAIQVMPRVNLMLFGPFLSENEEIKLNSTQKNGTRKIELWFQWRSYEGHEIVQKSECTTIYLEDSLDQSEGEQRSLSLNIDNITVSIENVYSIVVKSISNETVPFSVTYKFNLQNERTGVIYACILLVGLYVLIIFEVINRTLAAITVSTMSLAALALAGERPTLPEVISWLDSETLLLLFSMMLLVAIMAETGIFDFLAVFTFQVTKGKLWPLIYLLCATTAIFSTILDNVTTVLLMSPVTIRLCEVMDLDPVPILMLMAIFSNVGGTATPVGDPPNVIVASNKAVMDSGINFTNFTAHMALGILLVCVQTALQVKFMFRDSNKLRLAIPRDIQDLTHQISIWRRAADSLPHLSKGVHVVRERLERKIQKLNSKLDVMIKRSSTRACTKETFQTTLTELKEKYKIRDKILLIKASVSVAFVVVLFFLHSIPDLNRVSLGWTALLGAILLLTLADREDLEPILHRVEWSTLLFFAALFVLMEALSKLGLILYIGGMMENLILRVDENGRLAVAIMLTLWVSGVISGFVDNIPLTTMMVRVVVSIGSNPNLNLPLQPLVWALLYGACLGGNGTLIGASANVVCAGVAEQHGYKFTFSRFFKVGFPLMIGHLVVASAYLLLCHCVFAWH